MSVHRKFLAITSLIATAAALPLAALPPGAVVSPPVYVPNTTHQNDPLPAGVLNWDATSKAVDATNGQAFARFIFSFTNVAAKVDLSFQTNVSFVTNYTIVTNTGFWSVFSGHKYSANVSGVVTMTNVATVTNSITPETVTILQVHPSCGCTTAELPPVPWTLLPDTNSYIKVSVNLAGKSGTVFKTVNVSTDHGRMDLMLRINILAAPPMPTLTPQQRAQGVEMAKVDRQAVFKGDCASCHAKDVQGKYGAQLFSQVCSICHEANPRATMVPDLHALKDPTSEEFWRAWITAGKPGTLMPAFAASQGGPLSDMQIASLSTYLNATIHSHVPPAAPSK